VSPFAVMWTVVDLAALVLVAAALARRDGRTFLSLRPLLTAQLVVIASAVAASISSEPVRTYGEWTLMVGVNLGYALHSWRGGPAARLLANTAIGFTTLAVVLIWLRAFSSIISMAIGLVFAFGALFAALLEQQQARVRA